LKDIKNEFNQTQSELSKCLNNVHNNIQVGVRQYLLYFNDKIIEILKIFILSQQTNLLGYTEIHTCNNLLITLVEEIEQIVNNLHNFQTQGCLTLSTMNELRKQLTVTEKSVKELKKKSDQVVSITFFLNKQIILKYFIII
jgi:phage shock protein A